MHNKLDQLGDEAVPEVVKVPKQKSKTKDVSKSDKLSHKEKKKMKKEVHAI